MSPASLVVLIVVVSLAAWALFMAYLHAAPEAAPRVPGLMMATTTLERPSGTTGDMSPRARRAFDDAASVTRRQFLNRAYVAAILVGLSNFALASLDYLWPRNTGGLGGKVTLGSANSLRTQLESTRVPLTYTQGIVPPGLFLMTYEGQPAAAEKIPAYVQSNVAKTGFMAIYRKCVHLGCTVPFCNSSKWMECPCHGSKYSINGEYRAGPAPRGLDRFRVDIVNGQIVVDASTIIIGPPRGTDTSQPQPEGPLCVNIAGA